MFGGKIKENLVHPDQNGFVPGRNIFYSTHTIRDLLFYCEKENIDMIMFCIDYTKAFDFLEFSFIKKALDLYNFGDGVKKWIEILFKGRESRISNNGYLSDKFKIRRSTPQGDPISPLIFIMGLEILFIIVRADENIKGIKLEGNEIKLTSLADDASYFVKDERSGFNLLSTIEAFAQL